MAYEITVQGKRTFYLLLTYLIALVWFINGLFCKLLNLVPRHQLIVAKIAGTEYAGLLTKSIGIAEIIMVVWIVSGFKFRWCAIIQIAVVATMNLIEFFLAPELLLFGKWNALFACILIAVIYCHAFLLYKNQH